LALPGISHPALDAFAEVAASYCRFIDGIDELSAAEFIQGAHRLLPGLYAAGVALPGTGVLFPKPLDADADTQDDEPDPSSDARDENDRGDNAEMTLLAIAISSKVGKHDVYREVYDPYDPPEEREVRGRLSDDLGDIYRDMRAGLRKWQRGETGEALWEWRFGLESHWGRHVANALRAINALTSNHEVDWPDGSHGAT
jgi:hypothetical protein